MKPRNGAIVGLLFLATCSEDFQDKNSSNLEAAKKALGTVPATEVAVWQKAGSSTNPEGRYLQAVAFDETRKVVVMFGGTTSDPSRGTVTPNQDTWEWSPATGKWTNRTGAGTAPDARSGAGMVFDSVRGKFVLFGGRAGSGFNLEDTWEWDPTTGLWTNVSAAGGHPSARSQHGMVYEKGTGKILLFGGGRSDANSWDGTGISASLGDTWEYDPATYAWKQLSPATGPSPRHDFGFAWNSVSGKALLFGGLQTDIPGASGIPKQDTWEWDATAATWTERTAAGDKPGQRYAHSMAFDGSRGKVVVFGGLDMGTGGSRNDLWDLDPTTWAWTQRLTGTESDIPSTRMYASLVSNDTAGRLLLVAGAAAYDPYGGSGGFYGTGGMIGIPVPIGAGYTSGSRDVWELEPLKPTFTNRTAPLDLPPPRYSQCMAYNPSTQRTYIFGGYDSMTGYPLDDLWEWDGKVWAQVPADVRPPARSDAGLAYDPVRKSLILYGGNSNYSGGPLNDTWEFGATKKWSQLKPTNSPDPLMGHGMVTDTIRGKILLFGGMSTYIFKDPGIYIDPMRNQVWEWDGTTTTWTNRTPTVSVSAPSARTAPLLGYDEGRQKLFLFDGMNFGGMPTAFWEWDPITAGWANRNTNDSLRFGYYMLMTYDSIRRREILLTDPYSSSSGMQETWELDTKGPTFYVRQIPNSPGAAYGATMVFDSVRSVAVLFGGQNMMTGMPVSDTWEYKVTNLGNGEGCTAAFAATCASGFCVEGVCCDVAACTGACKSCSVAGSEGTCVLATAGTEVAGSCAVGQSCDGAGTCKTKNGQACTAAANCASGFCVDGVCCDGACSGSCASCNQVGREGKCTPHAAGTDPQNECGKGTGVCKSTCDGVGSCAYPTTTVTCANCMFCDGVGTCSVNDWSCGYGGSGGNFGGAGGRTTYPVGGSGGYSTTRPPGTGGAIPIGGVGGYTTAKGGVGGGTSVVGGAAGGTPVKGGAAGSVPVQGGAAGGIPTVGGAAGGIPNLGGAAGSTQKQDGGIPVGGSGGNRDGGVGDAGLANLHKSGCGCELGQASASGSEWTAPFLFAGAAFLLLRRRRRR